MSVASVVLVLGVVVVDCGVFLVSSVRVELDDEGVVELCAASMVTEKHNAAAVVISFLMCRLLVVLDRICLPVSRCLRHSRGFPLRD